MDHGSRYVDTCQHNKDKGLNDCCKDGHHHEREGKEKRDDGCNDYDKHFFCKYVAVKTHGERDRPGEMADDLYREKKRGEKGNGAHEMLEIFKQPLSFDPLPVIIGKHDKSTAYGYVKFACRSHKSGNKSGKVTEEDKKTDRCDHGQVFFPFLSYELSQKIFEGLDDELEDALELGRDKAEFS